MVLSHVMWGCPRYLLQSAGGETNRILSARQWVSEWLSSSINLVPTHPGHITSLLVCLLLSELLIHYILCDVDCWCLTYLVYTNYTNGIWRCICCNENLQTSVNIKRLFEMANVLKTNKNENSNNTFKTSSSLESPWPRLLNTELDTKTNKHKTAVN